MGQAHWGQEMGLGQDCWGHEAWEAASSASGINKSWEASGRNRTWEAILFGLIGLRRMSWEGAPSASDMSRSW